MQAGDGVFRRNVCRGSGLGVVIRPELTSNASAIITNVSIGPGNKFIRTNYPHAAVFSAEAGSVCSAAEGDNGLLRRGIISGLNISDNLFTEVLGVNIVLGSVEVRSKSHQIIAESCSSMLPHCICCLNNMTLVF